ncbi:MAG: ubiquitin, partial [Saprospiraceae bacterium]
SKESVFFCKKEEEKVSVKSCKFEFCELKLKQYDDSLRRQRNDFL